LLLSALWGVACDDDDVTRTDTPGGAGNAGAPTGGSGGSGGATAGAGGSSGAAAGGSAGQGQAGDGGSMCVVDTLARYCAVEACPSLGDAPTALRTSNGSFRAQVILQDSCAAPDGSPRIRVVASYDVQLARALIYDAVSKQLVAASVYDDLGGCGMPTFDEAIGDARGFYGEYAPDCGAEWRFDLPGACPPRPAPLGADAGDAGDAGAESADAGVYQCILVQ
jgi:hypothetical protein